MSQPANDEFSQHLSDDEESNHEDASDTGAAPKQQQQNENTKKEFQRRDAYCSEYFSPVTAAEIQVVEKGKEGKTNHVLMAVFQEAYEEGVHGMDDAKEIWRSPSGPRTKPEVDTLSIDDLYNNLRVFEQEIQGASKTSSSAQNVAFVSQSKSSTNKVKSGFICLIYSLFAKTIQRMGHVHEDLEQIDDLGMLQLSQHFGHFAKECTAKVDTCDRKRREDSFYQHQDAGKQLRRIKGLADNGLMVDFQLGRTYCSLYEYKIMHLWLSAQVIRKESVVWKEQTPVGFDKKKLDAQFVTTLANEIYEKDEKLKRYRRIGMKAVKEKEQLQKTLDSWKDSSKNLWRLINSGMSSNNKLGLGYEIQSNNEVLSYEEEMNFSVFNCSKEDSVGKPLYNRFTKTNDFKGVPHPLSGDYTPTPQEEIDESLYVYGKKGPQEPEPNVSDDRSSEYSICQSNDSAGSIGTSSEHSVDPEYEFSSVPPEVYASTPVTTNEKGVSDPKTKEIEPSCVSHIKTPRQPIKDQATPKVNRKNWNAMMERELGEGYSFTKKKCFVCGSLSHLIKDCDYYQKKMAREAEFKKQRVFNTGNRVSKPVWTNANRVNHANQFVPRSVQVNTGRTNINSVRPNINTGSSTENMIDEIYLIVDAQGTYRSPSDFKKLQDKKTQLSTKDKIIRSDNGPLNLRNRDMLEFCGNKGIKQEYSNARTPQQNGVAERMNMTLIEAARTMLADSLLPTTFWAEAVSTACYIFNRVRVTKPQNKTPYELLFGHKPIISYIRPFGCHVTILDTLSVLGKFNGKSDEGFLVGYSLNSKAYRVYNLVTKRVEVNLHVNFLEDKPNVKGVRYRWMFDIDYLTDSINYIPVSLENQANPHAGASEVTNSAGILKKKLKRILKYFKGKPHLGLWYPRESPFDLEAFSDSDYGGSNLDRKSTTSGCQFLGQRLISWQCKKQTIVATSTTKAEYVAAANCCGQVLWVQNQLLDYGFNFMNTKIHIDNESTICIVKNPVYHSKTKHIEIRHHFIRDCYEKKLISVEKIHTDLNIADLLTKPFDRPQIKIT
ncbi:putative ribonuclease H-like domain-containing protein [Tanacetum coccineum]